MSGKDTYEFPRTDTSEDIAQLTVRIASLYAALIRAEIKLHDLKDKK